MNIFLAPHSDDEALFGSFIIQRFKPVVIVCTDGTIHEKKFNVPVAQRREESQKACSILGAYVTFLRIPEEELNKDILYDKLNVYGVFEDEGIVFAPAKTGGHPHHDLISNFAQDAWDDSVLYYSTYAHNDLTMRGEMPLTPTSEELEKKERALACYVSQIAINGHHFEAVKGKPEFLNSHP